MPILHTCVYRPYDIHVSTGPFTDSCVQFRYKFCDIKLSSAMIWEFKLEFVSAKYMSNFANILTDKSSKHTFLYAVFSKLQFDFCQ